MSNHPVVHFEMPYRDGARVAKFYADAFGWQMADAGPDMGHYILAATADTDENMMVTTPGTINGGFYPLSASPESKEPSVVIAVSDMQAAIESITRSGGEVLGEPQEIPGIGLYVSFKDTEGNRVSALQPAPRQANSS